MAVSSPPPGRYAPVAVLTVTLLVFGLVVAYLALWLRSGLHEQVLRREAAALTEVASMQLANEADDLAAAGVRDAPGELLSAVLKTSKLRGVFAVRVFDAHRQFNGALPLPWSVTPPPAADWARLEAGEPLARLHARESAAEVIGLAPAAPAGRHGEPLLDTWLPLRRGEDGRFMGAAEMWTDGHAVATEFAALDRRLLLQAVLAWIGGAVIIAALLSWAFHRLGQANRELRARTDDLLRANRELTLAAKTSALGAVTAHLMHELKNPIAGLEQLVAAQGEGGAGADPGGELTAASELTRRLRKMVNDVAAVMRDEQAGAHFELTSAELVELAATWAEPVARARGVTVESATAGAASLPGRRANLALLVLHNLLQNAIEASGSGGTVSLRADAAGAAVRFSVIDQGPGLEAAVRERLFQPCPSSKRGGSGLGLALSHQLARQVGGRIELVRSDARGTWFQLVLGLESES